MWAYHHATRWSDLDEREEPTDVGRRLDVGGFVFTDPPDALFRCLGPDYIRDAWRNLGEVLHRRGLDAGGLAWGMMHPGETVVTGSDAHWGDPGRWGGWTDRRLAEFDRDPRWAAVGEELGSRSPSLGSAVTWRSRRWAIRGDEAALGLRLIEAVATDEYAEWAPDAVFAVPRDGSEPWVQAAAAIRDRDQESLDWALAAAQRAYTTAGYRIVVRGFRTYAHSWAIELRFPRFADEGVP